jgi:hypothetical protein
MTKRTGLWLCLAVMVGIVVLGNFSPEAVRTTLHAHNGLDKALAPFFGQ